MRASMKSWMLALMLLSGGAMGADLTTCLSGLEVSAGTTTGDVTTGVTFAGTDDLPSNGACQWTTHSLGGVWYASINREGDAGIGGQVVATGGRWLWDPAAGGLYRGRVLGGNIVWPESLDQSIGCGKGIATISITLSVQGHPKGGSFVGCLDDTHLNPFDPPFVFPPHIWGMLTINN